MTSGADFRLKELYIETTSLCNLACIHCMNGQKGYVGQHLAFESFERILPSLYKHRPLVHLWGNGETMLHPRFLDMLVACRRAGSTVGFLSNGTLLTPEKADIILKELCYLTISIDGATVRTFEAIRKNSNFEKLLNNLEHIRAVRESLQPPPSYKFTFVAMLRSIHELSEMVKLTLTMGASALIVSDLMEGEQTRGQSLNNDPDYAVKHLRKGIRAAKRLGIPLEITHGLQFVLDKAGIQTQSKERKQEVTNPPVHLISQTLRAYPVSRDVPPEEIWIKDCVRPMESLMVRSNGNVTPCCASWRPMGNLAHHTLEEIWTGRILKQFRQALVSPSPAYECVQCVFNGWRKSPGGDHSRSRKVKIPSALHETDR